jgi:pimeloyl-ACP methyl ester carboxylesterase
MDPSVTLPRTRSWLDALAKPRTNKPLASLADAARRLGTTFSDIDHATLLRVARHLVVERDGELQWGFDPLHRSTSPARFDVRSFASFLEAVDCPTLFIDGGERGLHPADERERIAKVRQGQQLTLPDAGHMMHWTQPDAVSSAIADFVQA